jgi:hypothetical protein
MKMSMASDRKKAGSRRRAIQLKTKESILVFIIRSLLDSFFLGLALSERYNCFPCRTASLALYLSVL